MTTTYRGTVLHSLAADRWELIPDAALTIDAEGTIVSLEKSPEESPDAIDRRGSLIVPGLVDAHFHIPQIDVIGIASRKLIDWLRDHIFAAEIANADREIARDRARRSFRGLLASGTTAVAAYSSRHTEATNIAFEEAERAGIRAIIGKVLMDREAPAELQEAAPQALAATEELIERWHGAADGRLEVAVTPRFGITCSDALLSGAGQLAARHDVPIQTHLSENKFEIERTLELFPDCADYTEVYERANLIGPRSILAHCIHLSDPEITRLAAAGCHAVYCPDSNFFLHSGRFPIHCAREAGLSIALGSDIGAGTSWSLLEAMKMGNYMQTEPVDPGLLFHLGTLGGARALGWEDRIGNFLPGKSADFAVLEVDEIFNNRPVAQVPPAEVLSMVIHRGHRAAVREVYIAGDRVHESLPASS